jgi:hypothetical protein
MNRRFALLAAAGLVCALLPSVASSQVKPAASSSSTPAAAPSAPAKWVPPIKGEATVEYTQSKPTRTKDSIETKFKVKNTSKGSIALLSVEEIWYNQKGAIVSNGTYRHRALLNPGDTIEFTLASVSKPDVYQNSLVFRHANGTIPKPKKVPKL